MDKEKTLKKFKIRFIAENTFSCALAFIWMYTFTEGIITEKQWVSIGLWTFAICIVLGFIDSKISGKKRMKEHLAVMPMIISIHDTVDGLERQRFLFITIQALLFGFGFGLRNVSIIFILMFALSILFSAFARLTTEKIKYLESKPEGL